MLDKLIEENNIIINETTDNETKEKHLLIKKMLSDKNCFFKINIETAYAILRELNVSEENLKNTYEELID